MTPGFKSLLCGLALIAFLLLAGRQSASAQVSPAEVLNPQLKALETEHFQRLIALNRQISATQFPFKLVLSRYVDVDPKDQAGLDTRGLEFVRFHERVLLKCTGNYNAAFNSKMLTRNQRAGQVFTDVILPILRMLPEHFPEDKVRNIETIGFEISYHVREASGRSDYEGQENLVVILTFADAVRFPKLTNIQDQQSVLNNSEIYVSGEKFGMALGKVTPLSAEELWKPGETTLPAKEQGRSDSSLSYNSGSRSPELDLRVAPGTKLREGAGSSAPPAITKTETSPLTSADVDQLEAKFESTLKEYGKFVESRMPGANYGSPDLALFRNSLYLQLTLKNPEGFDKEKTSLYKRAALSFDTFLAPHIRDLLPKLPAIPNLAGLNITVLVRLSSTASSSEAVEFICPLSALQKFSAYEITNQDLIDQSLVIFNGVRISLKLQQVE